MKKAVCWLLGAILTVGGVMVADYARNNRCFSARLHTVVPSSYQETMTFSAPVHRVGNAYQMRGAVRKIENITAGAIAEIICRNRTYVGCLESLEPTFDGIYYATVTVENMQSPQKEATAVIRGNLHQNVLFVPEECVTTDESGSEVIFVVQNGYAMLRRVKTGSLSKEGETEIQHGVFPMETVVISPPDIRTGDRIFSQ